MKEEATLSTISAPRTIFWRLSCVCSGTQRPLPSWRGRPVKRMSGPHQCCCFGCGDQPGETGRVGVRWVLLSPGLGCWDQRNSQALVQGSTLYRWPAHTGYQPASSVSPGSTLSFHIENALQMRICPHLAPVGWRKILLSAVLNVLTLVKFSWYTGFKRAI